MPKHVVVITSKILKVEAVLYCDGDKGKGYWNIMTQIQILTKKK